MKVEQLPRDFIAASHVARVAIQLANMGQSTPEQELNRAWRLIEVARGMVREHAAFRPVTTEPPKAAGNLEAEFVSLPGPGKRCPISGLSRSTLYQLAAIKKITPTVIAESVARPSAGSRNFRTTVFANVEKAVFVVI